MTSHPPVSGRRGRTSSPACPWGRLLFATTPLLVHLLSCGGDSGGASSPCGPTHALVPRVVDGDTIEIEGGDRVRYLLVDAPEVADDACYAREAADFNASQVGGREVTLTYDEAACRDRYGRLLAYVSVDGREVNRLLIEQGYACVYVLPPAGESREAEFRAWQDQAIQARRGLWGVCREVPCGR